MTVEKNAQFEVRLRVDRMQMTIVGIEFDGTEYDISPRSSKHEKSQTQQAHQHGPRGHDANHNLNPPTDNSLDQHGKKSRQLLARQMFFGVSTLLLLILCQAGLAILLLKDSHNLIWDLVPWTLYLDVTVVSLVATIGYLRMYRYAQTNHMTSMMIGMTVGMQVGMMTGASSAPPMGIL